MAAKKSRRDSLPASRDTPPPATPEMEPKDSETPRNPTVVGIAASAGGLEALEQLLRAIPAGTGLSLLIVQHMSPTHDSLLAHLLSKCTSLPIIE